MRTSTRRHVAFAFGLSAVIAMSGFLLNAAPPQAVGTWEVLGTTDPSSARSGAATATLEDDTTLIAGGRMVDGTVTDSVLVYDPTTNASTVVGQLASPRVNAAAARLDDGRVLIVGGEIADLLSADAEIFDPSTGTSTVVANMAAPRTRHAATRLADGKVLIVGGVTLEGVTLATAEVFDPETGSILEAGSMTTPRAGASVTLLIDNRVLVAGGNDGAQDLASAELFYPATQEFFPVDTALSQARAGHTAVLLPHNGAVLMAGGTAAGAPVATTDLFLPTMFPDPYTWSMGTFGPAEHLTHARSHAVSGPMGDDGYAFVAGGGAAEGEAYAFVTLKTDKDDYAPGEFALITGSGWQAGEEVTLVFQEDPAVHPDYTLTLTADGEGNISHDAWAPEEHDLNVRFYLMATGVTSQRRAQITFTDSRTITSVTLNGGSSVSVAGGASIAAVATVNTTGGNGSPSSWNSIGWRVATTAPTATADITCVDTPNHNGPSTYIESFAITAPASGGPFNAYFIAFRDNQCAWDIDGDDAQSTTFVLANSVTLTAANVATTTAISAPTIMYGQNGSVTVTVAPTSGSSTPTGSVSLSVDGGAAVSGTLSGGSYTFTGTDIAALIAPNATVHSLSASYAGATGFLASGPVGGTLTVNVKPLTVTASNRLKTYGDTVTFAGTEFTTSALVGTDTVTGVTLTSTGAAAAATVTAPGPTYPIVASVAVGTGLTNYAISYVNGTLTVDTKALTVTANNRNKTYGDTATFLGTEFTTTALVGTDAVTSVTLTSTGAAAAATVTAPGPTYPIVASLAVGTGLDNYAINYVDGVLTVNTKPLTVTANSRLKTYGDAATFLGTEFTTTALVGADSVTSVTLTSTGAAASATVTAPGPTYPIVASLAVGTGLDNYAINYVDGVLTVNTKPLTVTANSRSKTYGDTATFLGTEFTTTALVGADSVTSVTLTSTGAAAAATVTAPGPTYPIVASLAVGTGLDNYAVNYLDGTLTVNTKPLTVTASNRLKLYGDTVTFDGTEFTTTALVGTDAVTSVTLTSTGAAATATVTAPGPTYPIVASLAVGTGLDNYAINYVDGTLTVEAKPLTVTANSRSKTYGDTATFLGTEFTTTALVGTDAVTSVTLTSTGAAATATVTAPGPTYPIVASVAVGTGLTNYAISYVNGTLTVDTKALTVTANNRNKTYGDTATFLGTEFTTTALVGTDAVTSVTLTSTGAAAAATVTAPGPTYPIVASLAVGTGLDNYAINYVDGVLTVNTKPLTVTANSRLKTYGDAATFLGTEFTTTALVGADSVTSVTLTSTGAAASATVTAPGPTYPIVASLAVGTGLDNYAINYVDGVLTVNTKPLTVTANSRLKTYGDTATFLGTEFTTTALVGTDAVTSVTLTSTGAAAAATVTAPGPTYPIVASLAVGTGLGNYAINYVDGVLTVNTKPLTVTANSRSKTYGVTATFLGTEFTTTPLVGTDSVTSVTLMSTGAVASATVTAPGPTYPIVASLAVGTGLGNYAINYVDGVLTVNTKPLTVTANSFSKLLGATYTFLGSEFGTTAMVAGDGVTSVTLASVGAAAGAGIGGYDIVASAAVGTGLGNYAIDYVKGTMTVVYPTTGVCFGSPGHQVLQPLNIDGTSVVKKGSTVPVKFRVCDVNGNSVGTPGVVSIFRLVQIINGTAADNVNEEPASNTPDAEFRWSATDKQWIFNLNTKNLTNGKTYVYEITLNDTSVIRFQFGTKQ